MNPVKAIVFYLLLTSNIIYSIDAFSESAPAVTSDDKAANAALPEQNKTTGTIIIRDKDNAQCSLFLPGPGTSQHRYYLGDTDPVVCKGWNDRIRSIQFAEMPSATRILLSDAPTCSQSAIYNTWILLRTTKKQTTTAIHEIDYLMTFQEKQIIDSGLQLLSYQKEAENFRDRISCIEVTTSALPPAPPVATP
ncbi:hypothetical protein [Pseudomonas sp. Z3-6]|uniref:hypothetical protein n=1 Tax=Pseudomonas sp. Z3-6 TaxID=2817411 RepID=UPI003DA7B649